MEQLQLHDIKGFVEIPDNSIYYFYTLLFFSVIALVLAIFFLIKYLKREKAIKLQEVYLEHLKDIDLSQSKKSAYILSKYGELLDKDDAQAQIYQQLLAKLDNYKYQKEVPDLSHADKELIEQFLVSIHAR